jgi:hypothetical protein
MDGDDQWRCLGFGIFRYAFGVPAGPAIDQIERREADESETEHRDLGAPEAFRIGASELALMRAELRQYVKENVGDGDPSRQGEPGAARGPIELAEPAYGTMD